MFNKGHSIRDDIKETPLGTFEIRDINIKKSLCTVELSLKKILGVIKE